MPKEEIKKTEKQEELVEIYIHKPADVSRSTKAKVFGLNGKMYTVPYDKPVKVPKAIAKIYEMSEKAREKRDAMVDSLADKTPRLRGV